MDIQKIEKDLQEVNVAPNNLIMAIVGLLEILHVNGLDDAAQQVLNENGIEYEFEVENDN